MNTESFNIYIETEDVYEDIANDVEKWFDTLNYENDRPLSRKFMIEFVALRSKTYSYLMDDDSEHKRANGTKKCIMKREIAFKNYKDCLLKNKIILKSQHGFKSEAHNVHIGQINKIALSSNDDKRLQSFDKITTYSYGTNAFIVWKIEMLSKYK